MFRRLSVLAIAVLAIGAAPAPTVTPQALIAQSRATLDRGDFLAAARIAENAAAQFPANADAVLLAANFMRDRYGLSAALPWYDRVLQLDPKNLTARLDKAAALGDAGRTTEMLDLTREVLALDPKNAGAFILQAMLAARAGQWELARSLYQHANGRMDAVPAVMLLRGAIGLNTGGTEGAIAALRGLVDAQPMNRPARHLLALALWRAHDAQGTIETLKPISDDGDAWAQLLMARACETVGDRLGAAILLDRAAAGGTRSAWASGTPGDAAMAAGRWNDAAAAYTAQANSRFAMPTAFRLIDALNRKGDRVAGETVMATMVEQFPASAPVLRLAAADALSRGEWGRAATALELARLRIGDGDAQLLADRAWASFERGRRSEARDLAARAYALGPARATIAASYGWFLAQSGDRAGGAVLLRKAVAMAPGFAPFAEKLAQAERP